MSSEYFNENCIVKNEFYNRIQKLINCPKCKTIYQNPLMCTNCGSTFCENCIINKSKCESCNEKKIEYKENISKNELLSKISYKCKNCFQEVFKSDIDYHLSLNCQHKEKEEAQTLKEIFGTKKELTRIGLKELEQKLLKKEKIYSIRGNSFIY